MHLVYIGKHGILDLHALSTPLTAALLLGAALGYVALVYALNLQATAKANVRALRERVEALESRLGVQQPLHPSGG